MIDRAHDLPITKQAAALNISRGSVDYLPRPVSASDLALMRRIDELHLEFPLRAVGCCATCWLPRWSKIGPRHVTTLMKRMGMRRSIGVPVRRSPSLAIRSIRICSAVWRSRDRTRCGRWTSPTSPWRAALCIWPWCSTGSVAGFCRGACRSRWRRHSASRRCRRRWRSTASRRPSTPTRDRNSRAPPFTGVLIMSGIAISMDGSGAWRDNVFVERLWRSVKYEEIYLRAYDTEARTSLGRYFDFYNGRRTHTSLDRRTPDQAYFNQPVHLHKLSMWKRLADAKEDRNVNV
jgi:putative transposase